MKISRTLILLIFFLIVASGCIAQSAPSNNNEVTNGKTLEILRIIDNKIREVHTYKATQKHIENDEITAIIKTLYKSPSKKKQTITHYLDKNEVVSYIISDGKYQWSYLPHAHTLTRKTADKVTPGKIPSATYFVDEQGYFTKITYIGEEKGNYVMEVLNGYEKAEDKPKEKSRVFYNKQTGLVEKVIFYDSYGAEKSRQEAINYDINVPINDDEFAFTPPDDVYLTDLDQQSGPLFKVHTKVEGKR